MKISKRQFSKGSVLGIIAITLAILFAPVSFIDGINQGYLSFSYDKRPYNYYGSSSNNSLNYELYFPTNLTLRIGIDQGTEFVPWCVHNYYEQKGLNTYGIQHDFYITFLHNQTIYEMQNGTWVLKTQSVKWTNDLYNYTTGYPRNFKGIVPLDDYSNQSWTNLNTYLYLPHIETGSLNYYSIIEFYININNIINNGSGLTIFNDANTIKIENTLLALDFMDIVSVVQYNGLVFGWDVILQDIFILSESAEYPVYII